MFSSGTGLRLFMLLIHTGTLPCQPDVGLEIVLSLVWTVEEDGIHLLVSHSIVFFCSGIYTEIALYIITSIL
jgi:hypothetical protein